MGPTQPALTPVSVPSRGPGEARILPPQKVVSLPVGSDPETATYDSQNGYVYVTNYLSNTVSMINGTTVVGTAGVGAAPYSATFDGGNGFVYVPNVGSDNVSVINGSETIGSVPVGITPSLRCTMAPTATSTFRMSVPTT